MLQITLLYGGLLGVLMALLSIRVPIRRATIDAPWGDGGDIQLSTQIRVFGNFIEYVPAILLLMALLEFQGVNTGYLHLAGIALLLSRIVHAISLTADESPMWRKVGRGIGAMTTWLNLLALSVAAIYQFTVL